MSLVLQDAVLSDIPAFVILQSHAFQQTNALNRLMFPTGLTPSLLACDVASHEKAFKNAASHYMKVIDTEICHNPGSASHIERDPSPSPGHSSDIDNQVENGNIVGFARWYVWHEEGSAAEWDVSPNVKIENLGPVADVNHQVATVFLSQLGEQKRTFVQGRKCVYLSLLATHPSHGRRGVATKLLKKITEQADQEGLECWLLSSPTAQALYQGWGFREVSSFEIDLDAFGGSEKEQTSGVYRTSLMKREQMSSAEDGNGCCSMR